MAFKKLRRYQAQHQHHIVKALRDGRDVLYNAPTGAGKSTVIAAVLACLAGEDWNGAVVTVPMLPIRESFTENGAAPEGLFETSVYNGEQGTRKRLGKWLRLHWEDRPFASVACRQSFVHTSLPRDLEGWVLVVDEAHGSTVEVTDDAPLLSEYRRRWLKGGGRVVVVSATPYRPDGLNVYDDDYVQVRRSIAEHSLPDEDGKRYAPKHFEISAVGLPGYRVRTKDELYGEKAPRVITDGAVKRIVREWRQDGCPKVIVSVPPGDSRSWSQHVVEAFRNQTIPGRNGGKGRRARVHNAVGTGKKFQDALMKKLNHERRVTHFDESVVEEHEKKTAVVSEVDVIVACERFNEGTDWPLCSHVYHVGFPKSVRRVNQRWGRSYRSKDGIKGHTHPETARITFFVPEFTKEMRNKMSLPKFERMHLRMALLMAGHLEDHRAGQMLVSVIRDVIKINTPLAPISVDLERVEAALQPTDEEWEEVSFAYKHLRPDEDGALSPEDIDRVAEQLGLDERGKMLLCLRVAADTEDGETWEEMLKLLHKACLKATRERKGDGGPKAQTVSDPVDLIPDRFNALFDKYVVRKHGGKVKFNPPMSQKHWRMLVRLTGRDAKAIDTSMNMAVIAAHDPKNIDEGLERYYKEHGEAASSDSGDATKYVGYPTTWEAIDRWSRTKVGRAACRHHHMSLGRGA